MTLDFVKRHYYLPLLLLLSLLSSCSPQAPATTGPGESRAITVGAASNLQLAFAEIGGLFEQETGDRVVFSFGSTGILARQIESGAPIDIFAAADIRYVDELIGKKLLINDTQRLYAVGRLVLAVNREVRPQVQRLEDLALPEIKRIAIANPAHAPYGAAAKEALQKAGLWDQLSPKLVIGENISQAMQFVKTGNAEAGLIALSVANTPEITYTLIPDENYKPIEQSIAVVRRSRNQEAARAFVQFVGDPRAVVILRKYGFDVPSEN